MTMNLHAAQVHGFFSVPTDPLTARALFVRYLQQSDLDPEQTIVVAPDMGRAGSASRFAAHLGWAYRWPRLARFAFLTPKSK